MVNSKLIEASEAAALLCICRERLAQIAIKKKLTIEKIRTSKGGHPKRYYVIKEIEKLKKERGATYKVRDSLHV
jgi:hypothetical protein